MDHGYPQALDSKILRQFITQEGNRMEQAAKPPVALTNAVSWRSEGIKHKKNEIFLDVVEKVRWSGGVGDIRSDFGCFAPRANQLTSPNPCLRPLA